MKELARYQRAEEVAVVLGEVGRRTHRTLRVLRAEQCEQHREPERESAGHKGRDSSRLQIGDLGVSFLRLKTRYSPQTRTPRRTALASTSGKIRYWTPQVRPRNSPVRRRVPGLALHDLVQEQKDERWNRHEGEEEVPAPRRTSCRPRTRRATHR